MYTKELYHILESEIQYAPEKLSILERHGKHISVFTPVLTSTKHTVDAYFMSVDAMHPTLKSKLPEVARQLESLASDCIAFRYLSPGTVCFACLMQETLVSFTVLADHDPALTAVDVVRNCLNDMYVSNIQWSVRLSGPSDN